jgi:hypothetical protein
MKLALFLVALLTVAAAPSTPLPPPPPSSVTTPPASMGVPPTPVPSFPGVPAPISSGAVSPSQTIPPSDVANELRPSLAPNNQQLVTVQRALAAGGYYRGPIDGELDASTRAAVARFQSAARLPETGLLDGETLARLNGTSTSTASDSANRNPSGANGTTATAGTPLSPFFPATPTVEVNSSVPFPLSNGTSAGTPFPLASPLNMSATPPPGTTAQP